MGGEVGGGGGLYMYKNMHRGGWNEDVCDSYIECGIKTGGYMYIKSMYQGGWNENVIAKFSVALRRDGICILRVCIGVGGMKMW